MRNSGECQNKTILYLATQTEGGGAQRYIADLARSFSKKGYAVHVAAGGNPNGWLRHQCADCGIPFHFLSHLRRAVLPLQDILAVRECSLLYRRLQPSLVHLNSSKAGAIGSFAAPKSSEFPLIYTAHGFVFKEPNWARKRYGMWVERTTSRKKTAIICVSEDDRKNAILRKIAPAEKLITIPVGISNPKFLTRREARKILKIQGGVVVGTIANLYPTKGIPHLIEAANILKKKGNSPPPFFVVIGEGNDRSRLELKIRQFGLSRHFRLLGHRNEAYRYLKAFDIFALPSVKEGMPYTILEAVSAGIPVVASRVGGIPEIITHRKNGFLVPPARPADLANAINRLSQNTYLRKKIASNSALPSRFSLHTMVKTTERIYLQAFSQKNN